TLLNKAEDRTYTVTQCKDNIKWLKKKWCLYREDQHATGYVPKSAPPPCLELMMEHWAPKPGMQSTSSCDGTTVREDVDTDNVSSNDDTAASSHNIRKQTNGECVEEGERLFNTFYFSKSKNTPTNYCFTGLRELADGVNVMVTPRLFQDVVASLSSQENALDLQTAAINELITQVGIRLRFQHTISIFLLVSTYSVII
ncbi:hypothetical protein GN958_ATG22388, partial [Phytophthora infestans]